MSSSARKRAAKANVLKLSFILMVVIGLAAGVLVLIGVLTTTMAALVIAAMMVGMLVMHGGAMEMVSGVSDHEEWQKQVEDDEQWKVDQGLGYHDDHGEYQEHDAFDDDHHDYHEEHHDEPDDDEEHHDY